MWPGQALKGLSRARLHVSAPPTIALPPWLYPGGMLASCALFVWLAEPAAIAIAGTLGLCAMTLSARPNWTPDGRFGWANAVTWLRILACAALVAQGQSGVAQVLAAFAIFALDGVDGAIARATNTSSAFGAELDKECDAFFVLSVGALLYASDIAGLWVLSAGAWRYVYCLILATIKTLRPAPRSSWARYSYSSSSCLFMLALWPQVPMAGAIAALAAGIVSASFLRSLYYGLARS